MWFTENPWPPIFLLGITACVLGAAWYSQGRTMWLGGMLACLLGCVVVYFVEEAIVTEGEQVERSVREMISAFHRKDRDRFIDTFSKQAALLRQLAAMALDTVDVPDDLDIKDMSVTTSNANSRAVSRFRANGKVSYKGTDIGHQPSFWELVWQREGNEWRVVEVKRLNVVTGKEIPVFDLGQ